MMKRLRIDRSDFEPLFETSSYDATVYLDSDTGDVIIITQDDRDTFDTWVYEQFGEFATTSQIVGVIEKVIRDWDARKREVMVTLAHLDDSDRYIELPGQNTSQSYGDMEKFIVTIKDKTQHAALETAIQGKGAFSRFKNTLTKYDLWDAWNKFIEDRKYKRMAAWLKSQNIEPSFF
ncbi:MAG: UPF0158 family protein [Phototrophicales bacterium]|nr:UPF0158 family protein [Phototrophicales bacterium]